MQRMAAGIVALAWAGASAQVPVPDPEDAPASLDPIVVSATRVAEASADLPVSIDRIGRDQIESGQLKVNLSEPLLGIPGVNAQLRQNYAQDLQISVRGFGARSSFGVRGVRLYDDGIPGTMPDGQGQFSNFDLGSIDHIEVMRGPFSALYGNSSGGVIAVFTEDAPPGERVDASASYGSFDTQRDSLTEFYGDPDGLNLVVDAVHFSIDGYRDHSAALRNLFNAKAGWRIDEASSLTLILNAIDAPNTQDPLGLTRAQLAANPRQAGTGALTYDTRKSVQQQQIGLRYERALGADDELSAMLYGGGRNTLQYQAIPAATEAAPTNPGGVVALGHGYWGSDVHVTDQRHIADTPLQTSAGVNFDNLSEGRRGYLNFIGPDLGVEGTLRLQEGNRVYDFDQYVQTQWDPEAHWRAILGFRNSTVEVSSVNHLAAPGTARDSGVRYATASPVAGLTYRAAPALDLYGSYGKGFETPTLDELIYRSTNGSLPGLNLGLRAARSDNYEVGVKSTTSWMRATLAGFFIHTTDEVAVQANAAGRSVYENIPDTQRRGLEAQLQNTWSYGLSSRIAYTYLQALTLAPYSSCITVPCVPVLIGPGHRIPAVPEGSFYAGLTWSDRPQGFAVTLETTARGQVYANDTNTQAAGGYWLFDLHTDWSQLHGPWRFEEGLRVDNLANRRYVGSVIVNETNQRYFEPEPGRAAYLMISASYR